MITPSSASPSIAHVALAPESHRPPMRKAACFEVERDLRIARALRKRRHDIHDEMESCLRQRANAYALADAFLDEFDELAERDKGLRRALTSLKSSSGYSAQRHISFRMSKPA